MKAETLVSEWRAESKQEQREKQMLLFRKSSQEPQKSIYGEEDADPYMLQR